MKLNTNVILKSHQVLKVTKLKILLIFPILIVWILETQVCICSLLVLSQTDNVVILSQVLGKDIPPISLNILTGKKRSGVDVFKEERGREERSEHHLSQPLSSSPAQRSICVSSVCRLESSIAQVSEEIGQLSADVLQAKMQLEDHGSCPQRLNQYLP